MSASRSVLVVDDEVLFLRTVADGFRAYAGKFELLTAHNGREALDVLGARRIDLVVTDLKMPDVDGFELLAAMSRSFPDIPVLVMTAFGTPDIQRQLSGLGVGPYLEKPLDFRVLAQRVVEALDAGASGAVKGIGLPSFLQIIQLEQKSCILRLTSHGSEGRLHFDRGQLVDARTGDRDGDVAALEIVCWDDVHIEILPARPTTARTVELSLTAVLMEGFRQHDEATRGGGVASGVAPDPAIELTFSGEPAPSFQPTFTGELGPIDSSNDNKETEADMTPKEKLQELSNIDGFAGAAVFTPTGEDLALLPGSVTNIKDVGVLANNVLMNAQKAALEMGAGRGQLVHVEGEKAHILVRCLNEGNDPLKSQPQRAHIHTVLVLKPDASIGMAKMKLGQVVDKLAEDFR